jgi:hypothetical protein
MTLLMNLFRWIFRRRRPPKKPDSSIYPMF